MPEEPRVEISSKVTGAEFVAVFITHKRYHYLDRSLRSFVSQPLAKKFDVVISLDFPGSTENVAKVIRSVQADYPDFSEKIKLIIKPAPTYFFGFQVRAEQYLDQHIFFALARAWDEKSHRYGLIIEEDLEISPDYLELATKAGPVLDADESLFCLSAWNDNGYKVNVDDPSRLLRSGVFPGLGWMVTRKIGLEILSLWPGYSFFGWDQWMRTLKVSKGRECIAPEMPRVFHFGWDGVHIKDNGSYEKMAFAQLPPGLGTFDASLKSINLKEYDEKLFAQVKEATIVSIEDAMKPDYEFGPGNFFLVPHNAYDCGELIGKKFAIFGEIFCRMTHRGLFELKISGKKIFFVSKRFGAEWLPRENSNYPDYLVPIIPSPGETCKSKCEDLGYICSLVDAAHALEISRDSPRPTVYTGFSCEVESSVCPCLPKTWYLDFRFHHHQ